MTRRLHGASIRHGNCEDLETVLAVWALSGARPSLTDSAEALGLLLAFDPSALLVAEVHGEVVGSLIAAWNGWRGSFYRLAVRPDNRRQGLATLLVREGERCLRERGAVRLDAVVAADERAAMSFWQALGYRRQADQSRLVRNF